MTQGYIARALAVAGFLAACQPTEVPPKDGCFTSSHNTILFEPPLKEPGEYKFTLSVDGKSGDCQATLTGDNTEDDTCENDTWTIYQKRKGAAGEGGTIVSLPRTEILGLLVGVDPVEEVTLKVTRGGSTVIDDTFEFEETVVDDALACEPYTKLQATVPVPDQD